MKLDEIKKLLAKHKTLHLGPAKDGKLQGTTYILVDTKQQTIMFTTDTMDYLFAKKMEEAMEKLNGKFGCVNFEVAFHIHPGAWHDKDIYVKVEDIEDIQDASEMPEMIKYIMDTFYKECEWAYSDKYATL